jgi:hypothetical protein
MDPAPDPQNIKPVPEPTYLRFCKPVDTFSDGPPLPTATTSPAPATVSVSLGGVIGRIWRDETVLIRYLGLFLFTLSFHKGKKS